MAFNDDIQLTQVAGVLLQQVEQDPLQGRRVGAVPAFTGLAHVVEVVGGDDGPAPLGLIAQVSQQGGGRFVVGDVPAAAVAVGPRVTHTAALKAPLEPAQLDVAQVLEQLKGRPARRRPGAPPLGGGQGLELSRHAGAKIVEVAQEDLGVCTRRGRGLGKRLGHEHLPELRRSRLLSPPL